MQVVMPIIEYPLFEELLSGLRETYSKRKADNAFVWFHEHHTPEFKRTVDPIAYIRSNEERWLNYEV